MKFFTNQQKSFAIGATARWISAIIILISLEDNTS